MSQGSGHVSQEPTEEPAVEVVEAPPVPKEVAVTEVCAT